MPIEIQELLSQYDAATGKIEGAKMTERRLADLAGCFADVAAYEAALSRDNPLVYTVCSIEPANGEGDLHFALARLLPGRIGCEYFLTKGHFHRFRPAAEFYFGLTGEGLMLLEDEADAVSRLVELRPNTAVYVPGHTAHRTINVGGSPLSYIGVYPANAGHDYSTIAKTNFRSVVVERTGKPALIDRKAFPA